MPDKNTGFQLKDIRDINKGMFASTDPMRKSAGITIVDLPLNCLHHLKGHRFKLYTGQRFTDMVESIRANGVYIPIIVRPIDDNNYEILSGHNRVEAAKEAGLETIPAIIREGLTEDEAWLIATETNLIQRSFLEMSHSERAFALSKHYEMIKKQGKRNDLIQEIENMINASNDEENSTSAPMVQKLDSREKVAQNYGLDRGTITRYLRVDKMIAPLKERLDNDELAVRAAVTLSYLSNEEQQIIEDILDSSHYKLDMEKADALRTASEKKTLNHEDVEQILAGTKKPKSTRPPAFKLKSKIVSRYFKPEQKPDEIEATIIEALDFYYAHKKQEG